MDMEFLDLTIEKEINSTPANIYNSLTDPLILSKWLTTNAKGDLSIGGRFSNDDDDQGEYLELKPFEKIRFTLENSKYIPGVDITEVSIEIISLTYDVTRVRINQSKLESEEQVEIMTERWNWTLDNLKSFLESGVAVSFEKWKRMRSA